MSDEVTVEDPTEVTEQRVRFQQLKRSKVEELRANGILTNWAATLLYDRIDRSVEQIYAGRPFRDFDVEDWCEAKLPYGWIRQWDQMATEWWPTSYLHYISDSICPWNPRWPGWHSALFLFTFALAVVQLISIACESAGHNFPHWQLLRILLVSTTICVSFVRLISVGMGADRNCPYWVTFDAYWTAVLSIANLVGIILVAKKNFCTSGRIEVCLGLMCLEMVSLTAPTIWRLPIVTFLLIDAVLSSLHSLVTDKVAILLSALNGVSETYEGITPDLMNNLTGGNEDLLKELTQVHKEEKRRAQVAFHRLASEYPQVALVLRTRTVAVSCLQAGVTEVENRRQMGLLDPRDYGALTAELNNLLRHAEEDPLDAKLPNTHDFVANLGWLAGVEDEVIDELVAQLQEIRAEQDVKLFSQGDPTDGLYIIRSGAAEWSIEGVQETGIMVAGAPIGDVGILFGDARSATVTTVSTSVFYFIPIAQMNTLMAKFQSLRQCLIRRYILTKAADYIRGENPDWTDLQLRRYVDSQVAMKVSPNEMFQPLPTVQIILVRGKLLHIPENTEVSAPTKLAHSETYHNATEETAFCFIVKP